MDARAFALGLMLTSACAASAKPVAQTGPAAAPSQARAPADVLPMRDLRRDAPKNDAELGALRPVPIGAESLSKRATAK